MIKNYKQLVPRYLMANKKTSLSMAISILFSVAMLVSVSMFIGKYNAARIEMAQAGHGKYHAGFRFVEEDSLGKLKRFNGISKVGTTITVGQIPFGSDRMEIQGADSTAFDLFNVKAIKGRVPEKESEIAIEEWIYNRMEKKPKIGESFKLKYALLNCTNEIIGMKEKEFIFCGILEDFGESKTSQSGKAYITLDTAKKQLTEVLRVYQQWFVIKDILPVGTTLDDIQAYALEEPIKGEHKIEGYLPNVYYQDALKLAKISRTIAFYLNLIIAVAVAMVIYNVFNISVMQRKKHYGLLRAIGITQKQIKNMIFLEAFLFEAIVVPAGILLGILSATLLTRIIGGTSLEGSILKQITPFNILLPVLVSLISIAAAVYNPAKIASKVSAVESMSMEGKKSFKKLYKTPKMRIVNFTGKMALDNLKRYKKRFAATIMSIAVGIAIFIFSAYIINFLNPLTLLDGIIKADYVLTVSGFGGAVDYGYSDNDVSKIQNLPGVISVNKYKLMVADYVLDKSSIIESAIEKAEKNDHTSRISLWWGGYHVVTQVYGCSDEFIQSMRKSVSKNGKGDIFIMQNLNNSNLTKIKKGDELRIFTQFRKAGQFIDVDRKIKVDYVLSKPPMKINEMNAPIVTFVPYKFMEDDCKIAGYQEIDVNVDKKANLSEIEKKLKAIAGNQKDGQLTSYESEVKKWRGYQLQIGGILMSIVIVIAIVGFVNIMNTMNMNIIIRKREFGMLRAIGFTKKDMKKTLLKEAAIYGVSSSILGIGMGYFLIWVVYSLAKSTFKLKFYVDLKIIILTFVVTVILSICSSILPLKKISSEDIVESIQAVE